MTCAECPATYFGEIGPTVDCWIKEHKRSTEKQDVANRIAAHNLETNSRINREGETCTDFNILDDERMFIKVSLVNVMQIASTFAANCMEHTLD